jgi:hypothetical protein
MGWIGIALSVENIAELDSFYFFLGFLLFIDRREEVFYLLMRQGI